MHLFDLLSLNPLSTLTQTEIKRSTRAEFSLFFQHPRRKCRNKLKKPKILRKRKRKRSKIDSKSKMKKELLIRLKRRST